MELPHLIVFYLFLEQFHTDYGKYTYMPRRQAGSQDKARQAATIAVNDGRPLSFCRKSKWNLTEKKITSCSFQWVDIILFSLGFFFCRQPPWSCVAPTVYVCAISTCTGLLRVCVCASSSSSGLRVSKLLLSVDFLFIYFMPTHIRAKQFDRCRRLSGCLAD